MSSAYCYYSDCVITTHMWFVCSKRLTLSATISILLWLKWDDCFYGLLRQWCAICPISQGLISAVAAAAASCGVLEYIANSSMLLSSLVTFIEDADPGSSFCVISTHFLVIPTCYGAAGSVAMACQHCWLCLLAVAQCQHCGLLHAEYGSPSSLDEYIVANTCLPCRMWFLNMLTEFFVLSDR